MERRSDFNLYKVQQNLAFKKELKRNELEEAFEKLVKISRFDGAKIIDDRRSGDGGGKFIKITTADNKMVLDVNSEDISISYLYDIFQKSASEQSQEDILRLYQSIFTDLGYEADCARYRRVWLSDAPGVRKATIARVMSPAYGDKVDELDIDLDLSQNESPDANDLSHFVKVTTFHTTEMHEQFEKNESEDRLDTLIVIDEYKVIGGDEISLNDINNFLQFEAKRKVLGPEI
jgi:hypothetical protein